MSLHSVVINVLVPSSRPDAFIDSLAGNVPVIGKTLELDESPASCTICASLFV
jgi:hypothetical protein